MNNEEQYRTIHITRKDSIEIDKKVNFILVKLDKVICKAKKGMSQDNFDIVLHEFIIDIIFTHYSKMFVKDKKFAVDEGINMFFDYLRIELNKRINIKLLTSDK